MLDGGQFVGAVARLGYPGASVLKGEDFDWLFDLPEHQQFLHFFCNSVTKSNVLSPEEVRSFGALRDSGKPLLDESELREALKACQAAPPPPAAAVPGSRLEEADMAQLAEELQALQGEKKLKVQRLKRLQVLAATCSDAALRLASRREDAASMLREGLAILGAENAETNAELRVLAEQVKWLASFLQAESPLCESDGGVPAQAPPKMQGLPIFLSLLSLEPYLHQEELNTKTLALYTQKQFFSGIVDMVETSSRDNFPLLDLSDCAEEDEAAVEARRAEMARLQWAHIVTQHQLLQAQAEELGTRAGLQWITQTLSGKAKLHASAQALQAREVGFQQELLVVQGELEALECEAVPVALRESARLLNVPVVRGDLDLQLARQEYYTSRQDRVCAYLLRQKASFELLCLAQELELREGGRMLGRLGELSGRLESSSASLRQRLHAFSQPELGLAHAARPCRIIGSKDAAFSRLYKALERDGEAAGEREEPFRTFEGLERASQGLREDLYSIREALGGATREQAFAVALVEGDLDSLRGVVYSGLQQLVLMPQELRGHLLDLEAELKILNNLMKDMVGEIRGKKAQLEQSRTLRRERDLYVYFHLDDKLLKRVVQDLEASVCGKGGHLSRP